jgi:hypothetical protein
MLQRFVDNRPTDGGEVVSPTRRRPFTARKILGTHFYYRLSRPQGLVRLEGLGELKNPLTSLRIEPCNLQACRIAPLVYIKKLHGLSPRANYTDRATAACRRSDCQLVRIKGATWSA